MWFGMMERIPGWACCWKEDRGGDYIPDSDEPTDEKNELLRTTETTPGNFYWATSETKGSPRRRLLAS